jgi:hypothetical protein
MASLNINLKLMILNAENLFLLFDKPPLAQYTSLSENEWQKLSTSIYDNKPLHKCRALAHSITEIAPDIIALSEVGGLESLSNFNNLFLGGTYSPALIEGNSDRHIDVGFLIKKGLPFYFDLITNKNYLLNFLYPHEQPPEGQTPSTQGHKFSRDCAELWLFDQNRDKPFLLILNTHLKSPLDKEGVDPNGFSRRQAELRSLVDIYNLNQAKHDIPILVVGDFNGNASSTNTAPEFTDLYLKTPLKDAMEIAGVLPTDRNTFYHIRNNTKTEGRQIDYCFLNPKAWPLLDSANTYIYRYKDALGFRPLAPQTLEEKQNLPSDHYPVVITLQNLKI